MHGLWEPTAPRDQKANKKQHSFLNLVQLESTIIFFFKCTKVIILLRALAALIIDY